MRQKLGRNDPCHCKSGKKYKKCHGRSVNEPSVPFKPPSVEEIRRSAIVVRLRATGEEWCLGSGGVSFSGVYEHRNIEAVQTAPMVHRAVIRVDLPAYIPVQEDTTIEIVADSKPCTVSLRTKARGQEDFTSLDTTALPYFTGLVIRTIGVVNDPLSLLKPILGYLDDLARMMDLDVPVLQEADRFSILVCYERLDNPGKVVARSVFPLTGTHRVPNPSSRLALSTDLQRALNKFRVELTARAEEQLRQSRSASFADQLLAILHDFVFYARQHSRTLSGLSEEELRDLFLLPLKAAFRSAEGEVYNYNGKTDIKATDPSNRYCFGVIEFKKWHGRKSFAEAYSQAVREHSSGQESFLFIVVLSENVDLQAVVRESSEECRMQPETVKIDTESKLVPSDEPFYRAMVKVRAHDIPLTVAVLDLHFQNVRVVSGS